MSKLMKIGFCIVKEMRDGSPSGLLQKLEVVRRQYGFYYHQKK